MSTLLTALASLNWVALFFGLIVINRKVSAPNTFLHGNALDGSSTVHNVHIENIEPEINPEKDDEFKNKIEVD